METPSRRDNRALGRSACCSWEVVCPDGRVRHYPYHNLGDAESTARIASKSGVAPGERVGCRMWPEPSPLEAAQPPCPGGSHTVRPIHLGQAKAQRGQS